MSWGLETSRVGIITKREYYQRTYENIYIRIGLDDTCNISISHILNLEK